MFNIIDDIIFEKYNEGKLSDDKMILLLEASNANKEELKRIKEKIKKKEKLTEAEKKKYEEYKKSRNKKIAIGVGIGAAGIAAAGIAVNHAIKEEDRKLQEQIKRWHEHDEKERKEREKERLERKEQEKRKQDELEKSRNDNADLIKQLQEESEMYYKNYTVTKKVFEKVKKELDKNEKEINNMRNKMGPDELVNDAYNTTITRLKQSRERLDEMYIKLKDELEKYRYEIDKREKKLEKFDL